MIYRSAGEAAVDAQCIRLGSKKDYIKTESRAKYLAYRKGNLDVLQQGLADDIAWDTRFMDAVMTGGVMPSLPASIVWVPLQAVFGPGSAPLTPMPSPATPAGKRMTLSVKTNPCDVDDKDLEEAASCFATAHQRLCDDNAAQAIDLCTPPG